MPDQDTIEVPVSRGFVALIDACDADLVLAHKWNPRPGKTTTYATTWIPLGGGRTTTIGMHRMILNLPRGVLGHHKNGNGLDNRRENICPATFSQNAIASDIPTATGFRGVWRDSRHKTAPWWSRISLRRRTYFLGSYPTPEEAARAYDVAARVLHGDEWAQLNFPDSFLSSDHPAYRRVEEVVLDLRNHGL